MTVLSQTIFDRYQVRKTKQQKQSFIELLQSYFPELQVQEGGFPKNRNLIIGDIETASVVLTAHYDTCAKLPFPNFITPKNPLLVILYSLLMIIPLFVAVFLINIVLGLITDSFPVHYIVSLVCYFGLLVLMMAGPANKHTANDNTSGVILLCELLDQMTPQEREKTAFVFFDNEENGLLGSSYFRKRYKKQMENKLLINFDCISDGDNIMLAMSKAARKAHERELRSSFSDADSKVFLFEKLEKIYYPSDQAGFKKAVAVASLNHKRFLGYYMDKIHTSKDTVLDEKNITLLSECTRLFLRNIINYEKNYVE